MMLTPQTDRQRFSCTFHRVILTTQYTVKKIRAFALLLIILATALLTPMISTYAMPPYTSSCSAQPPYASTCREILPRPTQPWNISYYFADDYGAMTFHNLANQSLGIVDVYIGNRPGALRSMFLNSAGFIRTVPAHGQWAVHADIYALSDSGEEYRLQFMSARCIQDRPYAMFATIHYIDTLTGRLFVYRPPAPLRGICGRE